MMSWCRIDSYHLIVLLMVATTECKQCDVLSVDAVQNSVVTLTCPLTTWPEAQVIWEVLEGERAERVGSVTNCSSSCTIGTQKPLCKMRAVEDLQKRTGSLIIRPVAITDAVWYRCTVQNRTRSYCSEIKIVVKDEPQPQTLIKECKSIDPVEAVLNETFMLQCPVNKLHASQLIWGTVEADIAVPITRCSTVCTSSEAQKPLCERAKTMKNGSLAISPMRSTDTQWFWCALSGSSTSCYKFKLTVKENGSTNRKMKAKGDSPATQSPQEQTNGSTGTVVTTSATLMMITLTTSVIFFVAMLVGVYICFRKQKKKNTHKVELQNPYEAVERAMHNDFYHFSLVQLENENLCTFELQNPYEAVERAMHNAELENPYEAVGEASSSQFSLVQLETENF